MSNTDLNTGINTVRLGVSEQQQGAAKEQHGVQVTARGVLALAADGDAVVFDGEMDEKTKEVEEIQLTLDYLRTAARADISPIATAICELVYGNRPSASAGGNKTTDSMAEAKAYDDKRQRIARGVELAIVLVKSGVDFTSYDAKRGFAVNPRALCPEGATVRQGSKPRYLDGSDIDYNNAEDASKAVFVPATIKRLVATVFPKAQAKSKKSSIIKAFDELEAMLKNKKPISQAHKMRFTTLLKLATSRGVFAKSPEAKPAEVKPIDAKKIA